MKTIDSPECLANAESSNAPASAAPIEKLLIVDDHGATRQWLRTMLGETAREICESSDGIQAIEKYAEEQPDWVLMDMEMKPMDGLTATRMIKEKFPEARILIVTNHQTPRFEEVAFEAGATSLFPKEDLWKVRHVLETLHTKSAATAA